MNLLIPISKSARLIVLAASIQFCLPATAAESDPQADLDAVNSAILEIQSWLDDAHSRASNEQQSLREADLELAAVRTSLNLTEVEAESTSNELALLADRQEKLQQDKVLQSELLEQVLRTAYMSDSDSALKQIFNQQDLAQSGRIREYYRSFSALQIQTIAEFENTLAQLSLTNRQLEESLQALNAQQLELASKRDELASMMARREAAIASLTEQINSRSSRLEQLEIDRAQLEQLIAEINRAIEAIPALQDLPPFAEQRGNLSQPVAGNVVQRFGSSVGAGSLNRQGVTIAADVGTPVRAVYDGRVVFADWLRGMGLLVILEHGDGYMSLYGANQALSVAAGDRVAQGQVVALSGTPMDNAAPGVYFEIRHHGQAQNPLDWVD